MRILNSQSYDTVQGRLGEPYTIQRASNSNPRGVVTSLVKTKNHPLFWNRGCQKTKIGNPPIH